MSDIVWAPSLSDIEDAAITRFAEYVGRPGSYDDLWRWSVDDVAAFWSAVVDHFGIHFHDLPSEALADRSMPGAVWFPGATLNYAQHVFTGKDDSALALQHASEIRPLGRWTWADLRRETARIRAGLQALGVGQGDVVAAYLPNIPETVAALLATASLGAVWSSAAPEFGIRAVTDRFAQIEPTVLLAVDGYRYGAKDFASDDHVAAIARELGVRTVRFGYLDGTGWADGFLGPVDALLDFVAVPFEHPLWVLFSSGTTGPPKPIVHSQGGVLLEMVKHHHLHWDARPDDRLFWFTTTGWMMWNFLVSALLTEASIVLYDGNPATPSLDRLWDLAVETGMTSFGTSPAFLAACQKAGIEPAEGRDLSRLRSIGASGSPLAPESYSWVYEHVGKRIWLFSTSGGTDVTSALLAGVPTLPVYRGELQARALGVKVEAWDDAGRSVIGEVGELVVTEPMPSMPVSLWGDPDGARLRATYFEYFAGVWRHGDWITITERGTAIITGRSDSTINRGGVRMGTSEVYRAVLSEYDVLDALVVDLPRAGAENHMRLFVVLRPGATLDAELTRRIRHRIREDCSPRHVPDVVQEVREIPRTLSGKVLEVPVKRILMGEPIERAASRDSLANPAALDEFVAMAPAP
ncbi:acetoacetate--CoA ligase [Nocardioides sp. QY071]|uniref:acetoacetate--CoA ligase n=1 Tax=Nocardioides sp. QY071 TaxID=3044187 RepID=UPI00249A28EF|nr:acetoacetate--CoA ligase [Nocardioides sp. QY071]WGY00327.1 acetoacetate--CoA ligase [Nocardioides sp. QY071]